ncbi:hypothetical protein ACVJGC_008125 [Bradyrhizobium diazoefficiens]
MSGAPGWSGDLLDRKSDATFLIDFLIRKLKERGSRGNTRSFVLNIDAGWGHGKTYFLDNLRATLEERRHIVAYVNAWSDDHADDPLIAVMSAIEAAVNTRSAVKAKKPLNKLTQLGGQVAAAAAKGLVKQAITRYAGEDVVREMSKLIGATGSEIARSAAEEGAKKLAEIYDSEGKILFEKFRLGQKTIAEFKKHLGDVVAGFKSEYRKPLFILVDELDRCRPPYAIALLERVKHLFEVDDVVFVLATDTDQLRHSIGALYGVNFAAGRYLLRFFDQTYRFEDASVDEFVEQQFSDIDQTKLFGSPHLTPAKFAARVFKAFRRSLRDIEQCTDVIRNCVTVWSSESQLVLLVLLPLVILQQQRMEVSYDSVQHRLEEQFGPILWKNLDFDIWDKTKKKMFDGIPLFSSVVGRVSTFDLHHIANDDDNVPEIRVCRNILSAELRARFPNGYPIKDAPMSLIRDYPRLVRSVGRLSPS